MVHKGDAVYPVAESSMMSPPPPPLEDPPSSAPVAGTAPPLAVVLDMAQEQGDMLVAAGGNEELRHDNFPAYQYRPNEMATLNDMPPRGARVTVTGLMSNYNLNGKEGIVTGYRSDGAVLVDVDNIGAAPIHTENLLWGETLDEQIPAPSFMNPKMNTTLFEGMRIVRVKPPKRTKSDATCCPMPTGWADGSYFKQLCWIYTSLCCVVFGLIIVKFAIFLVLFSCGRTAVLLRWMAHRHLDVLLSACPPRRGIVVTHPRPSMKHASCIGYLCNGHTWRCLSFLVLSCFFSFISVFLGTMVLPFALLTCIRPLYALACNVSNACLWLERSFAVCLLCHVVGEYNAVNDLLDETPESPKNGADTRQVVRTYGAVSHEGEDPEQLADGVSLDNNTNRTWLVQRQRTMEEKLAAEKFYASFLKLFGRQPRLQDITIAPPREPGRGPRHFVTLADTVDDNERLKLIKAYKQMFSTMYVHIVDIDEQQRQEGTDYSEMYS